MTEPKKVVFAPGCFDNLEFDSQEELDSLVAEIQTMFETMTAEEIQAQSRDISLEELADVMDIDPEDVIDLIENIEQNTKRTLQ